MAESNQFSDYIVYADESGDHSLTSIDPKYPMFVLAFCIFHKNEYTTAVTSAVQNFKFNHFGHDMVLLHEFDIRKAKKEFAILVNPKKRMDFMADLSQLIEQAPFTIISMAIEKKILKASRQGATNPYHLALGFGLERIYSFLKTKRQITRQTHIVFESRGKKEDQALKQVFSEICCGKNRWGCLPFEMIIADKKSNSCGLQLADLIARPIGRYVLNPSQENRAYRIIEKKFYRDRWGLKEGRGLKCYPKKRKASILTEA